MTWQESSLWQHCNHCSYVKRITTVASEESVLWRHKNHSCDVKDYCCDDTRNNVVTSHVKARWRHKNPPIASPESKSEFTVCDFSTNAVRVVSDVRANDVTTVDHTGVVTSQSLARWRHKYQCSDVSIINLVTMLVWWRHSQLQETSDDVTKEYVGRPERNRFCDVHLKHKLKFKIPPTPVPTKMWQHYSWHR